jgi:hypothetical protein
LWFSAPETFADCTGADIHKMLDAGLSRAEAKEICEGRQVSLSRSTFVLPGGGKKNENKQIGPFCCTGETATVLSTRGEHLGYVHFFFWDGQAYNIADYSIFPNIKISVSGAADLANPGSTQQESSVLFRPGDFAAGKNKRVTRAGQLCYAIELERAKLERYRGRRFFKSGTPGAKVKVSLSKGSVCRVAVTPTGARHRATPPRRRETCNISGTLTAGSFSVEYLDYSRGVMNPRKMRTSLERINLIDTENRSANRRSAVLEPVGRGNRRFLFKNVEVGKIYELALPPGWNFEYGAQTRVRCTDAGRTSRTPALKVRFVSEG